MVFEFRARKVPRVKRRKDRMPGWLNQWTICETISLLSIGPLVEMHNLNLPHMHRSLNTSVKFSPRGLFPSPIHTLFQQSCLNNLPRLQGLGKAGGRVNNDYPILLLRCRDFERGEILHFQHAYFLINYNFES
jgi:hypothetical protein